MSAGSPATNPTLQLSRHTWLDDLQGYVVGAVLTSLGVALMAASGLVSGGTAGVAFLLHYQLGWDLGFCFVATNLPFFLFALRWGGRGFTIRSVISVSLIGVMVQLTPWLLSVGNVQPLYSALAGGLLVGTGVLAFVRHGASVGGINILAVHLQRSRGWSAGRIQMGFDLVVAIIACFVLQPEQVLYSLLAAVLLGAILAMNHKPGRYLGV